jgi:hypothetical protein
MGLLHLFENRHSDSSLGSVRGMITDRRGVRRRAWCALTLVLALNETVGDAEHGVNNDGVNAFGNLVLYGMVRGFPVRRCMLETYVDVVSVIVERSVGDTHKSRLLDDAHQPRAKD